MNFLNRIPDSVKGILLIIVGALLLFNTIGVTTEIIRTIVLIGSICIIILGIYLANLHTYLYRLVTGWGKKPPQP